MPDTLPRSSGPRLRRRKRRLSSVSSLSSNSSAPPSSVRSSSRSVSSRHSILPTSSISSGSYVTPRATRRNGPPESASLPPIVTASTHPAFDDGSRHDGKKRYRSMLDELTARQAKRRKSSIRTEARNPSQAGGGGKKVNRTSSATVGLRPKV